VVEFQLLKVWLLGRGHSEVGTETRHILHIIKTGTHWPVNRQMHVSRTELPSNAHWRRCVSREWAPEKWIATAIFGSPPTFAYSLRNVTLGSKRLACRPGIATAAIAAVASSSRAAVSTGTDAAPAW
jgi:hypothetical protein